MIAQGKSRESEGRGTGKPVRRPLLVYWSWVLLLLAIVAGVLALSGIAGTSTSLAYVLFVLFFLAHLVSLLSGEDRRRSPNVSRWLDEGSSK